MSHTKGKLVADALNITFNGAQKKYYCIGKDGTKDVVAIIGEVGDGQDEVSVADACRLVACWNIFEGLNISTEKIESSDYLANMVNDLCQEIDDFARRVRVLQTERDELLKKLHDMTEQIKRCDYTQARSDALEILSRYQESKS